jgi:hypothetical protein
VLAQEATRFLLINSTPQKPEGEGYLVAGSAEEAQGFVVRTFSERELTERDLIARGGTIANTALRVAEDMWNLDEWRMSRLRQFRIINEGLEQLHGWRKSIWTKPALRWSAGITPRSTPTPVRRGAMKRAPIPTCRRPPTTWCAVSSSICSC